MILKGLGGISTIGFLNFFSKNSNYFETFSKSEQINNP